MKWLQLSQRSMTLKLVDTATTTTTTTTTTINQSINWRFGIFPLLESLRLEELPNLQEICNGPIPEGSNSFRNLKKLRLKKLPALKHLWRSRDQNVSLCNLSSINIQRCGNLCNLFSLTMAMDCLSQLEKLGIESCMKMQEVLCNEENKNDGPTMSHVTFPKLNKLRLSYMQRLTTFCRGIDSIEFPVLTQIVICYCDEMKSLVSSAENNSACGDDDDDDDDYIHLFCKPKFLEGDKVGDGVSKTEILDYETKVGFLVSRTGVVSPEVIPCAIKRHFGILLNVTNRYAH